MWGVAVQRVLVKKHGGKCTYDGSMRVFSFSPHALLLSLVLFLGYTLAYLRTVVKHNFIPWLYFFLTFHFRCVTLWLEGGEKLEYNQRSNRLFNQRPWYHKNEICRNHQLEPAVRVRRLFRFKNAQ